MEPPDAVPMLIVGPHQRIDIPKMPDGANIIFDPAVPSDIMMIVDRSWYESRLAGIGDTPHDG